MKKFEIIDIAGDIGIKAHGNNKKEAFANVGLGLYEIMTGSVVKDNSEEIVIDMFSNDYEELLVDYLNELIFNFENEGFAGSEIKVLEISDTRLKAVIKGTFIDEEDKLGTAITAATFHNIKIADKYLQISFE